MKTSLIASTLTLIATLWLPTGILAAESPATSAEATPAAEKAPKVKPLPFQGKIASVDADAKTFTTKNKDGKENVFSITSSTKIEKADGSAGTIDDLKAGEPVRGLRLRSADGKWDAVKVILGAKGTSPATVEKPAGSM